MIEWKKYDPNSPPPKGNYLLLVSGIKIRTGRPNGNWWEDGDYAHVIHKVTHYAELNLPEQEEGK
jgi:hypothetical protein